MFLVLKDSNEFFQFPHSSDEVCAVVTPYPGGFAYEMNFHRASMNASAIRPSSELMDSERKCRHIL